MQGYFIYTNYKNKHKSWANAQKTGIVECSPYMVEERREKEFFDKLRMICAASTDTLPLGRSNLWFYHPWQGATIIAKSYMVANQQKEGENIPYAMGYYLTEDEHQAFLRYPEAFGREEQFEKYVSYQNRIADKSIDQKNLLRVRINDTTLHPTSFQTVWNQLGFTKSQFCNYYEALFKSIDHTDDTRVILHLNSEVIQEEILLSTIRILPFHLRESFAAISNWSDIMGKETIPEVFTLVCFDAQESKNKLEIISGTNTVTQKYAFNDTSIEKKYLKWIWDTVEKTTERVAFTNFLRTHFPMCLTDLSYTKEMSCFHFMKMAEVLNKKPYTPNEEQFQEVIICIQQAVTFFADQLPANIFLKQLMKNSINVLRTNIKNEEMISKIPLPNILKLDHLEIEGVRELLKQLFIAYHQNAQQELCKNIVEQTGETAWWNLHELQAPNQELRSTEINQQSDTNPTLKKNETNKEAEELQRALKKYWNNWHEKDNNREHNSSKSNSHRHKFNNRINNSDVSDNGSENVFYTATDTTTAPNVKTVQNLKSKYIGKDGQTYERSYYGQIVNGKPHGEGTMYFDEKDNSLISYQGTWKKGVRNGKGTQKWKSGDIYEGEWKKDTRHGTGTYTWSDGDMYEGEWIDGIQNGQGTYTMKNGEIYKGEWKNNKKHGKGTTKLSNGDIYEGEYTNGQRHGKGSYAWVSGEIYEGDWQNGSKNGQGTNKWPSGSIYVGNWKDGKHNGQGTYTWSDGSEYVGEWKDGTQNGAGVYTDIHKKVFNTVYANGKLISKKPIK